MRHVIIHIQPDLTGAKVVVSDSGVKKTRVMQTFLFQLLNLIHACIHIHLFACRIGTFFI